MQYTIQSRLPTPMRAARTTHFFMLLSLFVMLFGSGCASLGFKTVAPVKVPEVVALSKRGIQPEKIIQRMQNANMVYRLNAQQLANLREQGVSNQVINYMQQTYLNAVRNQQQLQDFDHWTNDAGWWYGGPYYGWPDAWMNN